MSKSRYPIQIVRGVPVIEAPGTLDLRSADILRATLLHLAAAGHVTVVVDMSATTGCDTAGQAELTRAYKRAAAEGGDLRLVAGYAGFGGGLGWQRARPGHQPVPERGRRGSRDSGRQDRAVRPGPAPGVIRRGSLGLGRCRSRCRRIARRRRLAGLPGRLR